MMIQSRRDFVRSIAALVAHTFFTGLEARAHAAAHAQEIAAPSPVRTPKEFFDYVNEEARRLNQNKTEKRKDENRPYDKSQYEKLVDEVLRYYKVPLSAAEIANSTNFLIGPEPFQNKIFIQFEGILEPDNMLIKDIEIFEDHLELKRWERKNDGYFLPINPSLYYAKPP